MSKHINPSSTRRRAYSDILEAKAHLDQGWYPTATALAEGALVVVKDIQSWVNIARIAQIHETLKASSYGKSKVSEVGAALFQASFRASSKPHS